MKIDERCVLFCGRHISVETSCILSPNPMVFLVNYGYVFKDVSGENSLKCVLQASIPAQWDAVSLAFFTWTFFF
jgi:hypothetical protein